MDRLNPCAIVGRGARGEQALRFLDETACLLAGRLVATPGEDRGEAPVPPPRRRILGVLLQGLPEYRRGLFRDRFPLVLGEVFILSPVGFPGFTQLSSCLLVGIGL